MNMGGAEVMLMDILRHKSDKVHMDFLVNYNLKTGIVTGDFDKEIHSLGSSIVYIGAQWDLGIKKYQTEFKRLYDSLGKPEVVHIHMNAKSGVIAWAAARAGAKKIIVHSHANLKIRGHWLKVWVSKLELKVQKWLIARYATDFWGCSQEANESLFYKYKLTTEHSKIINNAIDTNKFTNTDASEVSKLRDSYGLNDDSIVIGNVGRVVRHKNIAFIIQILAEAKNKGKHMVFVFVGRLADNEYMTEFWEEAKKLDVKDRIIHLGVREDVQNVMASFDVFVGPALQEGFGLVAVEAQATGIPCVLYTGFPQTVDMELGLVTFKNSFDPKEWFESIEKAVKIAKPNKEGIVKAIKEKGFDAKTNTSEIEEGYLVSSKDV